MKQAVLILGLLLSLNVFGQNKEILKGVTEVTFYGVDFSHAKVYGASEEPYQFRYAFEGINDLFISEPKKYNPSKFLKKPVNGMFVKEAQSRAGKINEEELKTTNEMYKIDSETLENIVKDFSIEQNEGVGLMIVGELLNKANKRGYFHVVFFDIKTRDLIDTWSANGKGGGFGLRNYWAHSVLDVLKTLK